MVIASGFFSDFFYSFDSRGELQYHYPQAGTINLGIWLYFIFGAYLLVKYAKTLSTEKFLAILMYYMLMFAGIPVIGQFCTALKFIQTCNMGYLYGNLKDVSGDTIDELLKDDVVAEYKRNISKYYSIHKEYKQKLIDYLCNFSDSDAKIRE
jgi:hypothetical protein